MACDKQDTEAIGPRPEEDQARMIPSAPPPPSYEEVLREDAEKRLVPSPPYPDELKDSAAGKQPHAGPWKSQNLGELVDDNADPINRKKKRQRKAKKVLGWTFWVACFPLAVIANCIREQPNYPDDPYDWNNDPLRPWSYRVSLS